MHTEIFQKKLKHVQVSEKHVNPFKYEFTKLHVFISVPDTKKEYYREKLHLKKIK